MFSPWDIVDNGVEVLTHKNKLALDVVLPLNSIYRGFLIKIVHSGGALIRKDLEIDLDSSAEVGTIEKGEVVRALERRRNSSR